MKNIVQWLLLGSTLIGITVLLIRKKSEIRKKEQTRSQILARAESHGHGEFVL
ncbi:MAG TPA: hypothetical protein VFO70_09490 [Chitinophagaceae bacterium]|nr:hypothetical protein [Chitinophagaceae bacterium]